METQRGSERERRKAGDARPEPPEGAVKRAAARRRAAIELVALHSNALKQTARRYSLCREDAEDAHQRAMEILLTKAPTDQPHELIRWTQTVVKHEALAIRSHRERLLGGVPATAEGQADDWIALIPASGDGPDVRAERSELIARSREALRTLKPAELRALTLLAQGYSYAEIGRITRFSYTKVNRCISEGREQFRKMLASSEDGSRCEEMRLTLSAFCDGEASAEDAAIVREHLRACAGCRATVRAYRAAPGAAAALAPALPISASLLERAQEGFSGLLSRVRDHARLDDPGATQMATAGGGQGLGLAGSAKALIACAGTAGAAAACVVSGVVPLQVDLSPQRAKAPSIQRSAAVSRPVRASQPAPQPKVRQQEPKPQPKAPAPEPVEPAPVAPPPPVEAEPVEASAPAPEPQSAPMSDTPGSAAGEFGP